MGDFLSKCFGGKTTMKTIKMAIIGAGRMGKLHAKNFSSLAHCDVSVIVDDELKEANKLSKRVKAEPYGNYEKALSEKKLDAVCISTPVMTHEDFIIKAINSNLHVFCEKPLTLQVESAERISKKVNESNQKFLLGFMSRFDKDFMDVKKLIEKRELGEPTYIRSIGRDPGLPPIPGWGLRPEECGGISFELCSHDYDRISWLMGDEIREVYARGDILASKEKAEKYNKNMINDSLVVSVKFDNGKLGVVEGFLNVKYGYDAKVEVVCEEGAIEAGGTVMDNLTLSKRNKKMENKTSDSFIERFHNAYINEAKHFIECILKDEPPKVSVEDGVQAVKVAIKVNESLKRKTPIKLVENKNE